MQLGDVILVSVDDPVCEPPDLFETHVPADKNSKRGSDVRHPAVMATPREIPGW